MTCEKCNTTMGRDDFNFPGKGMICIECRVKENKSISYKTTYTTVKCPHCSKDHTIKTESVQ